MAPTSHHIYFVVTSFNSVSDKNYFQSTAHANLNIIIKRERERERERATLTSECQILIFHSQLFGIKNQAKTIIWR